MTSVGYKLKEIRTKKKLTQSELAEGIVNRSYVSQIEKGSVQPSYKLLKKLCDRLDYDIELFFEDSKNSLLLDIKKALSLLEHSIVSGKFTAAEEEIGALENNLHKFTDSELALYYFCRGRLVEKVKKQPIEAIELYKESCELYKDTVLIDERIRSINHLVNLYLEENQVSEAFNYLDSAYEELIFNKVSGVEHISILTNLGIAHAKLGEYYSAVRFLKQAIQSSQSTSIYYHTGKAFMVMGLCQRRIKEYSSASTSYENALHFFKGTEDRLNLVGTYTNLGILKRYESDHSTSLEYLQKAHQLYKELDDIKGVLNTLYEMALTYFEMQQYEEIFSCYSKFNQIFQQDQTFSKLKIKFLSKMGDTHYQTEQYESAIHLYRQALSPASPLTCAEQQEVLIKLSKAFAAIGDTQSTLKCWEEYVELPEKPVIPAE